MLTSERCNGLQLAMLSRQCKIDERGTMTADLKKYLPSDEEVLEAFYASDRLWDEYLLREDDDIHWLDPIDTVVLAAVERAVAEETFAIKQRAIECAARVADMETRHAREIEQARSFLASLVEHEEIVGGSLVRLSTSYRLAKAALAALDGEGEK